MSRLQLVKSAALALAGLGYFLPWFNPGPAALKLTAYDLVEWLTFAAGVRDGTFVITRIDVLLPLILIAWLAATLTGQRAARYPALVVACGAAFLVLPAYPFILTAHTDPELQPQLAAGLLAFIGVGLIWFGALKHPSWVDSGGGLLAVGGLVCTIRVYALASPVFQDVLTRPAPMGLGFLVIIGGFILLTVSEALEVYGKIRATRV